MERNQPSKGHSHPGDHRGRDFSGHKIKVTKQGALTAYRPEGGTCQDTEGKQASKGHLPTGEHREKGKSRHGKNVQYESSESAIIQISTWKMK